MEQLQQGSNDILSSLSDEERQQGFILTPRDVPERVEGFTSPSRDTAAVKDGSPSRNDPVGGNTGEDAAPGPDDQPSQEERGTYAQFKRSVNQRMTAYDEGRTPTAPGSISWNHDNVRALIQAHIDARKEYNEMVQTREWSSRVSRTVKDLRRLKFAQALGRSLASVTRNIDTRMSREVKTHKVLVLIRDEPETILRAVPGVNSILELSRDQWYTAIASIDRKVCVGHVYKYVVPFINRLRRGANQRAGKEMYEIIPTSDEEYPHSDIMGEVTEGCPRIDPPDGGAVSLERHNLVREHAYVQTESERTESITARLEHKMEARIGGAAFTAPARAGSIQKVQRFSMLPSGVALWCARNNQPPKLVRAMLNDGLSPYAVAEFIEDGSPHAMAYLNEFMASYAESEQP